MTSRMAMRIGLFCVLGGLCFTIPAMSIGHFGWWWVSGILISATVTPVARFGPRTVWAQCATFFAVFEIVGLLCTMSEGVLFFPEMKKTLAQALIGGTVMYVIAAILLAVLARLLRLSDPVAEPVAHRPALTAIPMILLSGIAYVVYYLVFGMIAFQFFTKRYYPHAVEQVAAMGNWFWAYQWGRGIIMTLAILPIIYTLRMSRTKTALVGGLLVWIIGGAAPLVVPNDGMVTAQRYMHIIEIMSQNVALGMTAVWLLRPRVKVAVRAPQTAVHA